MDEATLASRFEQMWRRWPEIAVAVDVPLTKFFLHRQRRIDWSSWGRFLRKVSAWALVLSLIVWAIKALTPAGPLPYILILIVFPQFWRRTPSPGPNRPAVLLVRPNQDKLLELWMTPLTIRDLLAAEMALAIVKQNWASRLRDGLVWLGPPILLGWLFWAHLSQGVTAGKLFVVCSGGLFWMALCWVILSDEVRMATAMHQLVNALRASQPRWIFRAPTMRGGSLLAPLTLAGLCFSAMLGTLIHSGQYGIAGLVLSICAAGLVGVRRRGLPRWIQSEFHRRADIGRWYYQNIVYALAEKEIKRQPQS